MTAATCIDAPEDTAEALSRLRDVTRALYNSQHQTRYMSMERKQLIASLRSQGVTLRVIADATGLCVQTVWELSRTRKEG